MSPAEPSSGEEVDAETAAPAEPKGELSVAHWCITLERRPDRRFVMERNLPPMLASDLEFFIGVDGSAIPKWRAKKRYGKPKASEELKPSAWAVRLSKALAIREFLRSDHDVLCLYEDDVTFAASFEAVFTEALEFPEPWDCIFLGGAHSSPAVGAGKFQRCTATFNNHCLMVSREGGRKLRRILTRPWTTPWSDREIESAIKSGELRAFCPRNFVASQRATTSDNWGEGRDHGLDSGMLPDDYFVVLSASPPGGSVLEWGSGASTVLIANRVGTNGRVVSIDCNRSKVEATREALGSDVGRHVDLQLVPPEPERPEDDGWRYLPGQMTKYVSAPLERVSDKVDLAFIHGRERISCALVAAQLLKSGGYLIIGDFWGRERYRARLPELLEHYRYAFETPQLKGNEPKGLAVFVKR